MALEEIFEQGVSVVKTVWHKRGDKVSRQEIKRLVATDVQPRSRIKTKDGSNEG
jgi:hypothetical protein